MTDNTNNLSSLGSYKRCSVPDAGFVEESILQNTASLKQDHSRIGSNSQRGRPQFLRDLGGLGWLPISQLKPFVAFSIAALGVLLVFSVEINNDVKSPNPEIVQGQEPPFSVSEGQTMLELDWQELLLLQDEVAFASL